MDGFVVIAFCNDHTCLAFLQYNYEMGAAVGAQDVTDFYVVELKIASVFCSFRPVAKGCIA